VEIPPEVFRDVHESVNIEAFVVWARFIDAAGAFGKSHATRIRSRLVSNC
jgi:hypothetical protein